MESLSEDLTKLKLWELYLLLNKSLLESSLSLLKMVKKIQTNQGFLRKILFCEIDPQHFYLLSCGADKNIKVWDMKTFNLIKILEGHAEPVYNLLHIEYNKRNFLCSSSSDNTIKIWSLKTFKLCKTLYGHKSTPYAIAYINKKKILISGDWEGKIIMWSVKTWSMVFCFETEGNEIWSLFFDISREQIVIGSKGVDNLFFYDFYSGKNIKNHGLPHFTNPSFVKFIFQINSLKFHPELDEFLVCSGTNNIAVLNKNLETGESFYLKGHTNQIRSFIYCQKLKKIISASCDRTMKVWSVSYNEEKKIIDIKEEQTFEPPHSDNLNCIIIDKKENFVATCSWDGSIGIYSI